MPNGFGWDDDESCDAAPGVMGHLACNKSCCRESGTPRDPYGESRSARHYNKTEYDQGIPVSRAPPETFKIKYEQVLLETDKAVQYLVKDGYATLWLPKSIHVRGKKKIKIQKWFKPKLAYVQVL